MPTDHEYPSGHKNPTEKQLQVLAALKDAGWRGLTTREWAEIKSPGGDVSAVSGWGGCFTVLHQEGLISALADQREGHHVYVLPEWVMERTTWPGYRHKGTVTVIKPLVIVKHCETCTCEEK